VGARPQHFEEALARLCAAVAVVVDADGWLRPAGGSLAISATRADAAIVVRLDGWSREFPLRGDADDDRAEADAALDLVGAALFGDARVVVELVGGRAHAWTLELRAGAAWSVVSRRGGRSWWPPTRRERVVRVNHVARPAAYAAVAVPAAPGMPWLGCAGFSVAEVGAAAAELPIDGTLDLHSFSPKEVKPLVLAYLEQCRARGLLRVRIVHGKGTGQLRRTVHALLERHPQVAGYRLGGHGEGSWGATLVDLKA
jgi:hypothetical protein